MDITRETLKKFREDFVNTVKSLEESYHVKLNIGNITYDPIGMQFHTKLNGVSVDPNAKAGDAEKKVWDTHCERFGLTKETFGKLVVTNGKTLKVAGLNLSKRNDKVVLLQDVNTNKTYSCSYHSFLLK